MSGIIERLRSLCTNCILAPQNRDVDVLRPYCETCQDNYLAADEIEKLTKDRDWYKSIANDYLNERQQMRDLLPACLEEFGPSLLDALRDAMIQLKRVQDENKHLRNERDIWEAKAGAGSAMLRKILDQKKARTT